MHGERGILERGILLAHSEYAFITLVSVFLPTTLFSCFTCWGCGMAFGKQERQVGHLLRRGEVSTLRLVGSEGIRMLNLLSKDLHLVL